MDKKTEKSILKLLIYAGIIILLIMYSKQVYEWGIFLLKVAQPFIMGGAFAFVLNIPMRQIEKIHFGKYRIKRGFSILLTLLFVIGIFTLIGFTVVPQLGITIRDLGIKIPQFIDSTYVWMQEIGETNPQIMEWLKELENLEIDWNAIFEKVVEFLKSGFGNVLSSTVLVAGNIIGGVVNVFVAFVFAIYALLMKEKLIDQFKRILKAYLPAKIRSNTEKVLSLLNVNFSSFISGQCTEAVILGFLFFIAMTILRFPYALLVGVLVGFTSLIPIVGAFIGCAISAFLILVDDPAKAVWFIVLFLVIQQIEGNLIYPHVVGGSVGLPSIWVLTAVSIGGSLMGVAGMLLFIPLVSTGYALLRENVNQRNLVPVENRNRSKKEENKEESKTVEQPQNKKCEQVHNKQVRKTGEKTKRRN